METAVRHFGRLDVVVNVAGGLTTFGPIAGTSVADFDREIAINLKTAFLVSQAAVPALAETRGVIVNFASVAFFRPQDQMAVYAAAKAGVAAFTQSLALELRDRGVRVNAVAPGMVRTGDNVSSAQRGQGPLGGDEADHRWSPLPRERRGRRHHRARPPHHQRGALSRWLSTSSSSWGAAATERFTLASSSAPAPAES